MELIERVEATIRRYNMFDRQTRVLAAVSGGADSIALLHLLKRLSAPLEIELYVAHLNHQLRGEEADQDAESVRELCLSWGLSLKIGCRDIRAIRKRRHLSTQEAAREERYRFLSEAADEVGAHRIAVGHHRDDRAETVLLHIIRGCGISGLTGIPPVSGMVVRPLIEIGRSEIADYCRENHLFYRQDSSNTNLRYRRNHLRSELIPFIQSYYNPQLPKSLLRLADLAGDDDEALNAVTAQCMDTLVIRNTKDRLEIDTAALLKQPRAVQRRAVRRAIDRVRDSLEDIPFSLVERALDALKRGEKLGVNLPGGRVRLSSQAGRFVVFREADPVSILPVAQELEVPGHLRVEALNVEIWASASPMETTGSDLMVKVSASAVRPPMVVRNWRAGDILTTSNGHHRKLQDVFTDKKVEREKRHRIPIIADVDGIVWVVGVMPDHRPEATEGGPAIYLKARWLSEEEC